MRLTSVLSNIAVQTAEDDVDLILELLGGAVLEHEVAQLLAHGQALLPLDGIAVLLAGIPGAGSHGGEGEMRVEGEQEDEALAYAASCAEHACEIVRSAVGRFCWSVVREHRVVCNAVPCPALGVDSLTAPLLGKVRGRGGEVFGFHRGCGVIVWWTGPKTTAEETEQATVQWQCCVTRKLGRPGQDKGRSRGCCCSLR